MNDSGGVGLRQRWRVFLFGVVAASASVSLACGGNSASTGSAGSNTGGSEAVGGAGGSQTTSSGGTSSHGGAVDAFATDSELAPSHTACKPDCPRNQYCVLIGRECGTVPCLAHAVCRDLPLCGESLACPLGPAQTCTDDPTDSCTPTSGVQCTSRCNCAFDAQDCTAATVADFRPDRCECATPGPATTCLGVECPTDTECEIALGKAYCVLP
ncbi:MAG TPA: hypothetical protein VER96_23240 [Polyangiaceae bacterium]|nr:hypothetical protein [Polyangiaceae bacterium]